MMDIFFILDQFHVTHQKSIYGYLDLIADVGGLLDIVILMFALFLKSYN